MTQVDKVICIGLANAVLEAAADYYERSSFSIQGHDTELKTTHARDIVAHLLVRRFDLDRDQVASFLHRSRGEIDTFIERVTRSMVNSSQVLEEIDFLDQMVRGRPEYESYAVALAQPAPPAPAVASTIEALGATAAETAAALAAVSARRTPVPPPDLLSDHPDDPPPEAPPDPPPDPLAERAHEIQLQRVCRAKTARRRPKPRPRRKTAPKKRPTSPLAGLDDAERHELSIALEVADLKASMGKRPSKHFLFPSRARPEYHRAAAHELRRLGLAHLVPKNFRPAPRSRK